MKIRNFPALIILAISTLQASAQTIAAGRQEMTAGIPQDMNISFKAGSRISAADVTFIFPKGIDVTLDNTTVDIIGRGPVTLRNLHKQSIGRAGNDYSRKHVGKARLRKSKRKGTTLTLSGLDLRPDNGDDIRLHIHNIVPEAKEYVIEASAKGEGSVFAKVNGRMKISDLMRLPDTAFVSLENRSTVLTWSPIPGRARIMASTDSCRTWYPLIGDSLDASLGRYEIEGLLPDMLYAFKLDVMEGAYKGESNVAWHRSGAWNARSYGIEGADCTDALNKLIEYVGNHGGGTILFPDGDYAVRTVHLRSNVWLYLEAGATIRALIDGDKPEETWFDDRDYRSGLSATDMGPYKDPDNYMTKQDVGHTFFHNAMFFGERIENVKILGTGRITGDGHLVTSDKVMNNPIEKRSDKMFSLKLCRNIEIGGLERGLDLWYDEARDEPYYVGGGRDSADVRNMLQIDQAGHFVVLATGCDDLNVHDAYFGRHSTRNVRDILDFMACNDVKVCNIYVRVSSDDIVKLGSDCSLGFTRPGSCYMVRNIIGDTNCNLFQIGSETADDITDVWVDNIYVLGGNKSGFSISVNDGGTVRNVHLNSGKTGPIHHRSIMKRTRAPFFIAISNRGRVLGSRARMYEFKEGENVRKELLVENIPIGRIENVSLRGVDISNVYGGSSFRSERWKTYDGSQKESTAVFAGFKLPGKKDLINGRMFTLPDGHNSRYIKNLSLNDICLTVVGGHGKDDSLISPPEIGVGHYNIGDFGTLPAYGLWFRHVDGLRMQKCAISSEKPDGREPVVMDDVVNAVFLE